jgi:hypothetical protein
MYASRAVLVAAAIGLVASAAGAGSLDYDPVACVVAGTFPRFEARYEPLEQASSVRLFFRSATARSAAAADWYYVPMKAAAGAFVGVLPKPKSDLAAFSYYLEVIDATYGATRTPERTAKVVAAAASCQGKLAGAVSSAVTVAVGKLGGIAGGPLVPVGFSSASVVAAQETALAAAGVATAAAAGGGGISATTIGLVGAAVAGGAVAATQLGKSNGSDADAVFTGQFSGDLTMNFGGCARLERHAGTLRMDIRDPNGAFQGTAEIEGTESVVSSQCSGGPQAGFSLSSGMPATPLTGSLASMAFSADMSNAPSDNPAATVTTSWRFSGSGDGNTITGVLTKARALTVPGASGGSGSMTVPVTLRRQ